MHNPSQLLICVSDLLLRHSFRLSQAGIAHRVFRLACFVHARAFETAETLLSSQGRRQPCVSVWCLSGLSVGSARLAPLRCLISSSTTSDPATLAHASPCHPSSTRRPTLGVQPCLDATTTQASLKFYVHHDNDIIRIVIILAPR